MLEKFRTKNISSKKVIRKSFTLHKPYQTHVLYGNVLLGLNAIFKTKINHKFNQKIKKNLKENLKQNKYSSLVLFYDPRVLKKHKRLVRYFKKLRMEVHWIPIHASEVNKSFQSCSAVIKKLVNNNIDRRALFIGLGGGVIGDFSGFMASIYMRGVAFASIPTTLLSMVDSSIGGKNGVNFKSSKNLLGQIRQPDYILIDTGFLSTLPAREWISGLGEVVKYCLLSSKIPFVGKDYRNIEAQKPTQNLIQNLIQKCIELKMSFVEADEHDIKGVRQVLNLGHTFGHALESYTHYRQFKHGEAVLWGLKFALLISREMGFLKETDYFKLNQSIQSYQLPPLPKKLNTERLYDLALHDKKSENKMVKMVLLKKRGEILTSVPVSKEIFLKCVKYL